MKRFREMPAEDRELVQERIKTKGIDWFLRNSDIFYFAEDDGVILWNRLNEKAETADHFDGYTIFHYEKELIVCNGDYAGNPILKNLFAEYDSTREHGRNIVKGERNAVIVVNHTGELLGGLTYMLAMKYKPEFGKEYKKTKFPQVEIIRMVSKNRRQGIGRISYKTFEELCKKVGVASITTSKLQGTDSPGFFKKMGFTLLREKDNKPVYYKEL
ncbi:MAG: GNAT family N-acetyltransferase [archaeon]